MITVCSIKDTNNNTEIYNIIKNQMLLTYSNRSDKIQLIEGDNVIYQITTEKKELELLKNDDRSDNYTLSIIDLGQCESILKGN